MAFCTRCGQQTDGVQPAADGAVLCLFCGAGPEVHHGYPGRRASRHASTADAYADQDGAADGPAACRVPLSDYPSLTDLPAIADTWPTASYSSRSRSGRHALPPELATLRRKVTAQLPLRPGPPEFEDEQLAGSPFSLPYSLPEPSLPELLSGLGEQAPDVHSSPDDEVSRDGNPAPGTQAGPLIQPGGETASRTLATTPGSRRVNAAAAGLVVVIGATTLAIALAGRPQAPGRNAAGDVPFEAPGAGGQNSGAQADGSGTGPIGLVRPASAVARAPHEASVLLLLDRYFGAINAHNFAAYQKVFQPNVRRELSETAFGNRYGTATDSAPILQSITPAGRRRLAVMVTFTSHQSPGSSPTNSSCTEWSVRLDLVRDGHRYLITSLPGGHQPSARCP